MNIFSSYRQPAIDAVNGNGEHMHIHALAHVLRHNDRQSCHVHIAIGEEYKRFADVGTRLQEHGQCADESAIMCASCEMWKEKKQCNGHLHVGGAGVVQHITSDVQQLRFAVGVLGQFPFNVHLFGEDNHCKAPVAIVVGDNTIHEIGRIVFHLQLRKTVHMAHKKTVPLERIALTLCLTSVREARCKVTARA